MPQTQTLQTSKKPPITYPKLPIACTTRAHASNTHLAYGKDLKHFVTWCEKHNEPSKPPYAPALVSTYVGHLAKSMKISSIKRALSAIVQAQRIAGFASFRQHPIVQRALHAIAKGTSDTPKQKDPIIIHRLRRLVRTADTTTLLGLRDRAILLLGFAGAFRRSDLVQLDVEHLCEVDDGLRVFLPWVQSAPGSEGSEKGIPYGEYEETCPVRAVQKWLEAAGLRAGAIFVGVNRHGGLTGKRLRGEGVAIVVQRAATKAGLDATRVAGHSLRSGLATAAAIANKSEQAIMQQTGHVSVLQVRKYIRRAELFRDNAASGIGL